MGVHESSKGLEATLIKLVKGFTGDVNAVLRKTFFDIGKNIIEATPHDTGRARKGWIPTNDSPSDDKPPEGDYDEMKGSSPSIPKDPFKKEAKSWWWANNVEYIMYLEAGSSQQAPRGMVATSIDRMQLHLNAQLRKLKFKNTV